MKTWQATTAGAVSAAVFWGMFSLYQNHANKVQVQESPSSQVEKKQQIKAQEQIFPASAMGELNVLADKTEVQHMAPEPVKYEAQALPSMLQKDPSCDPEDDVHGCVQYAFHSAPELLIEEQRKAGWQVEIIFSSNECEPSLANDMITLGADKAQYKGALVSTWHKDEQPIQSNACWVVKDGYAKLQGEKNPNIFLPIQLTVPFNKLSDTPTSGSPFG